MSNYQEITNLQNLYAKHTISMVPAKVHPNFRATENVWIEFTVDGNSTVILVDDEFKDFKLNNSILNLCLVLRELETYAEEEDILKWSNFKGLSVSNNLVVAYYKGLAECYRTIESIIGLIDSQISDFDFELNAGAAQALRGMSS